MVVVIRWFNENKTCRPYSKTRLACKRDWTFLPFRVLTESPLLLSGILFIGGYRIEEPVISTLSQRGNLVNSRGRYYRWGSSCSGQRKRKKERGWKKEWSRAIRLDSIMYTSLTSNRWFSSSFTWNRPKYVKTIESESSRGMCTFSVQLPTCTG